MDESGEINAKAAQALALSDAVRENDKSATDEAIDMTAPEMQKNDAVVMSGKIRTLDGEIAGDEFASDAINYQVLLGKIDTLLERLKLDA